MLTPEINSGPLTSDELYVLRGLLSRLHEEPGLREQVGTWINGVYTLTSVLLDDRRAVVAAERASADGGSGVAE